MILYNTSLLIDYTHCTSVNGSLTFAVSKSDVQNQINRINYRFISTQPVQNATPVIQDSSHFGTFTLQQNIFMSLFTSMYSIVQNFGQFVKATIRTYKITTSDMK